MNIQEFNQGVGIFIDTNIFIYHLDKSSPHHQTSTNFLIQVECQQVKAFISTLVIDEIFYSCLLLKGSEIYPELSINALKKRINSDKKLIRECYEVVETVFNYIEMLRIVSSLTILEINFEIIKCALPIAKKYNLFPRDAIHLSTCQMFGIHHIATNDTHFQDIPLLTVWTPSRTL